MRSFCKFVIRLNFHIFVFTISLHTKFMLTIKKTTQIFIIGLLSFFAIILPAQNRVAINKTWEQHTGLPTVLDWADSKVDVYGNTITCGHTLDGLQTKILITKYSLEGDLIFEKKFSLPNGSQHFGTEHPGTYFLIKTTDNHEINETDGYGTGIPNTGPLYDHFNGTSAATPHVAGASALLLEYFINSDNYNIIPTIEDIEHLLEFGADDIVDFDLGYTPGYDEKNGWGRLNIGNSLNLVSGENKLIHVTLENLDYTIEYDNIDINTTLNLTVTEPSTNELIDIYSELITDLNVDVRDYSTSITLNSP